MNFFNVEQGVLQGETLFPLLFSLYFNHVTRLPLFDKYVGSVLRYASEEWEIWEFHKGGAF